MAKKIAFTMYPVKDIKRALTFYENLLEIKPSKLYEADHGAWAEFDLPEGGCLALTTMAEGVESHASAGASVAFNNSGASDRDCFLNSIAARGINPRLRLKGSIRILPLRIPTRSCLGGKPPEIPFVEFENLDEKIDQLKNENVTFKLDTFETPVCKMAVIIDTEGNAVTLHQIKTK